MDIFKMSKMDFLEIVSVKKVRCDWNAVISIFHEKNWLHKISFFRKKPACPRWTKWLNVQNVSIFRAYIFPWFLLAYSVTTSNAIL
jgi:hypothetical protein